MATQTVPMDDKDLMAGAFADEPTQETAPAATAEPEPPPEAVEPKADETGRLHGQDGKFVSKTKDAEAAPTQQQETTQAPPTDDDKAAHVPSWRLREVNEQRTAAERRAEETARQAYAYQQQLQDVQRQLAELKTPKPQPVDFFENPEGALQQRVEPIQQGFQREISDLKLNMSRELAVIKHGEQAVSEMETAVAQAMQRGDPDMQALAASMRSAQFPALKAMEWHQQAKLRSEIGNDLTSYKAKLRAELMQDPGFRTEAMAAWTGQAQARPNIQLPPSLHRQTGTAHDPASDGNDMSDAALYRYATASKGGR